jgi:hypothetical protein
MRGGNLSSKVTKLNPVHSGIQYCYDYFNSYYFNGKLRDMRVVWAELEDLYGLTTADYIFIASSLKTQTVMALQTLLHEMVHVKVPSDVEHGKKFNKEMLRLARAGAFDHLW